MYAERTLQGVRYKATRTSAVGAAWWELTAGSSVGIASLVSQRSRLIQVQQVQVNAQRELPLELRPNGTFLFHRSTHISIYQQQTGTKQLHQLP